MKSCFILEGGAKRGIYTAGVLDVFMENGIKPDAVIGVSAGAIHGCSFVSNQIGRGIRYNLDYIDDYRFMSFKSLIKSGNMVDTEFAYHELPEKLDIFDHQTFINSGIKFYVTCTNLESGSAEYILCPEMKGVYMDYLRAGASMPFVSQIVNINGKPYLDGGIADSIPLQAALDMGYGKNIVILTRPQGYYKKPFALNWLAKLVYRKFPNFIKALKNRHTMYNAELEQINTLEKEGKIAVIRPGRTVKISKMETNPDIVREMYNLGRHDGLAKLAEIKIYLSV